MTSSYDPINYVAGKEEFNIAVRGDVGGDFWGIPSPPFWHAYWRDLLLSFDFCQQSRPSRDYNSG